MVLSTKKPGWMLEEAKKRREEESKLGKTVHTFDYWYQQLAIEIRPKPPVKEPEEPIEEPILPSLRARGFIERIGREPLPPIEEPREELPEVAPTEEITDEDLETFVDEIEIQGRTPELEMLLVEMGATPEDVDEIFGVPAEVTDEEFLYQEYLRTGGKLDVSAWRVVGSPIRPEDEREEVGVKPRATKYLENQWGEWLVKEVSEGLNKSYMLVTNVDIEDYIVDHPDVWERVEAWQKEFPALTLMDEVGILGGSLLMLPQQWGAAILQATQGFGGASVVDPDWADRFIEDANREMNEFVSEVSIKYKERPSLLGISPADMASVSRNIAYSLTSMGAGLIVGLPTALIPVPGARVAAWTAGTAASGAVAYQMTTYQITQTYLELMNEEKIARTGTGLTREEEEQLKDDFFDKARKYGLWEAVPEALSNLAFAKLLTGPLTGMVGRSIASRIVVKVGGIYGEELLTETITQKGQSDIEVEAGLREGRISWQEAFKEVAPQTFLLTTIMGGLGQVTVSSVNKIKASLKSEIGEEHPLFKEINENITEDIIPTSTEPELALPEEVITPTEVPTRVPPTKPPLTEALIKEADEIVTKAEAIQPENPSVIEFRRLVNEAQGATGEVQRQALIKMEALEDEIRAIVPEELPTVEPEVVPTKAVTPTNWQRALTEADETMVSLKTGQLRPDLTVDTQEYQDFIDSEITRIASKYGVPEAILRKQTLWEPSPAGVEERIPLTEAEIDELVASVAKPPEVARGEEGFVRLPGEPEPVRTLPVEEVSKLETRIPIDLIRKDEPETIRRLTEEIQREGIKEPIVIRIREDGSQIVWDGIHRLIVAQDLGIKDIPVRFISDEGLGVKPPTEPEPPTLPPGLKKPIESLSTAELKQRIEKATPYRKLYQAELDRRAKPEIVEAPPVEEVVSDDKGVITPPPDEVLPKAVEDNTPMIQDIGVKERVRGSRHVFDKMGVYEIWEGITEAEVLVSEANTVFNKEVDAITKRVGKDKERWGLIFDDANEKGSVVGLTFEEKRAVNYIRNWANEWAEKKNLPQEKRIEDYIPHLFEQEMIDQIKERDGISPEIAGVLNERVSKKITDPFLKERLGALGFIRDPFRAMKAYNAVSNRVLYYEPFLQKIAAIANDTSMPKRSREYLKDYSRRMTGEPSKLDQDINKSLAEVGEAIRKLPGGEGLANLLTKGNPSGLAAYNLTSALYTLWLGFKATSAIRNLSQHGLIIGEVGPIHFANGIRLRITKEGRAALEKSLVLRGRKMAFTAGLDASFADNWAGKFRETALWMFRYADKQNVSDAFLSGYSEAKSLLPDADPSVWIKRADEVAADTQYLYTKMNSMAIAQNAPGRVFSMLTTWTENWIELTGKWITRRPSKVYSEYNEATGVDVSGANWSTTYKAVAMYLIIAAIGYILKEKTRLKALEYTGITSLKYMAGVVGGEFPALEAPGAVADLIAGVLTQDDRLMKQGWNQVKNIFTPGVIRQIMGVALGDKDWLTLFFYLEGKSIEIKRLRDKWKKGWEGYEDLSDVLIRGKEYPTLTKGQAQSKWREDNPFLEAQMFVVGQFTTLSSEEARQGVSYLIETNKLDPELIEGYEKVFGIDTSTELAPFQKRIGNLEKLVIGEEAEYFDMGRFAGEVHKWVNTQGRSKVMRDGHPLAVELLNAEDLWEPYFNQESADQRKLDRQRDPELEGQLYFWGKVQSFENPKSAEILLSLMKKYNIPPEAINAFQQDPQKYDDLFTQKFELEKKSFELDTLYDNYGNTESDVYIEDLEERKESRTKLKEDNPEWVADLRRIEAIDNEADEGTIESWVERGKTVDEFGAGSSEGKVWLLDNPEAHKWALEQKLLTDDGSDWNENVLRINVQWAKEDDEYNALPVEDREVYLDKHEGYRKDKRRRDGYSKGITEIEDYVAFYELPTKGYWQERFLVEHPKLAKEMNRDIPIKVLPEEYDILREKEDKTPEDKLRITAYEKEVPENQLDTYVSYYSIEKPEDYPKNTTYWEDDWFLVEHPDFYKEVYIGVLGNQERDFTKVPTREVGAKYIHYKTLTSQMERDQYRLDNPDLDEWGVSVGIWSVTMSEKRRRLGLTPGERFRESLK